MLVIGYQYEFYKPWPNLPVRMPGNLAGHNNIRPEGQVLRLSLIFRPPGGYNQCNNLLFFFTARGRMNGAPNENRTHSGRVADLAC